MLSNILCQHSLGGYSRGWLAVPRCKDVAGTPATLASEEAGVKTLLLSRGFVINDQNLIRRTPLLPPLPSRLRGPTVSGYLAPAKKVNFTKRRTAGLG